MDYRSAAPPRIESVSYYPHKKSTAAVLGVCFALMPLTFGYQAISYGRAIEVTCDAGVCDVRKDYGLFSTHTHLAQADVRAAKLFQRSNKGGLIYGVDLVLANGDDLTVRRAGALGPSTAVRDSVHRVIQSGGTLQTQESSPGAALLFGSMGLAFGALVLLFTRTARLQFHLDTGRIEYARQRWPLPELRHTFRADEVVRATVIEQQGKRGRSVHLAALVLRGDERFVLVPHAGGDQVKAEAAVEQINALLHRMRDPGV